ncbi:MAG: tetratricopeptide repeat protein [Planctomycetota bacterium]
MTTALPFQLSWETLLALAGLEFPRDSMVDVLQQFEGPGGQNEGLIHAVHGFRQLQAGKPDEALVATARALEFDPSSLVANIVAAAAYGMRSNFEAAVASCEKALETKPDSLMGRLLLGLYLSSMHRPQDAIAALEEALRLNPQVGPAYYFLARLHLTVGAPDRAIDALEKALKINPLSLAARVQLGDLYRHRGKNKAALAQYRGALQLDQTATTHHRIGEVLELEGDREGAIEAYREATRIDERLPHSEYRLGACLLELGRPEEAIPRLEKALELAPPLDEAREALERARKASGTDGAADATVAPD